MNMKLIKAMGAALLLAGTLVFYSCNKEEEWPKIVSQKEYELTIASKLVPGSVYEGCGNSNVRDVWAGKKEQDGEWSAYGNIEGFAYKPGNEYRILVEETTYEDQRLGEPVWTESKLKKVLSEVTKNSVDVPEHLISKQYYENDIFVPEYRFAVEAQQKELIEKDLKENPPFMVGANVIVYGKPVLFQRWIALDKTGKILGNGNLKHVNVDSPLIPDSYQLLPLEGVHAYQHWTFMDDDDNVIVDYDTFLSKESVTRTPAPVSLTPWFYKDVTDIYKAKFPDAGVKTVVYSLGLPVH